MSEKEIHWYWDYVAIDCDQYAILIDLQKNIGLGCRNYLCPIVLGLLLLEEKILFVL